MSNHCHPPQKANSHCCPSTDDHGKKSFDFILWPSLILIFLAYVIVYIDPFSVPEKVVEFSNGAVELMTKMWWGLCLSIIFVGWLGRIPREVVMGILGTQKGWTGLLRATLAGLILDLCNHGILVVGMRLYERGASLGQVIAFLVASPWNSFSMTVVLIALIGLKYTLVFIIFSCVIALISGMIFDKLVARGILPENSNAKSLPKDLNLKAEIRKSYSQINWNATNLLKMVWEGVQDSKMILRWIMFGVVLAAIIRVVMTQDSFETFFGPSIMGLGLTIIAATIIEVCSEGSAPIAADLVSLAKAPGNGFTFLMTGVSTDYTEIMALKETTKSWKIAFFLPLVTVPQIVLLGYILNLTAKG